MQTTSTNRVIVESEGSGVVAHVGLHAMGAFADRLGLSHSLSSRVSPRGERRPVHDRGTVLTHMALVIAGGGESCADVEHLRLQSDLFGHVASDSTVHRMFHELDTDTLSELALATAQVRSAVWDRLGLTNSSETVLLDIDATLVDVHSENKEGAAPTYKRGYGFHPILCFADATGECLANSAFGQRHRQHGGRSRQRAGRRTRATSHCHLGGPPGRRRDEEHPARSGAGGLGRVHRGIPRGVSGAPGGLFRLGARQQPSQQRRL